MKPTDQTMETAAEVMKRMGCNPIETLSQIALGELPCGLCRGAGHTKHQRPINGEYIDRTCEWCQGAGKEQVKPDLLAKSVRALAEHVSPAALAGPATDAMLRLLGSDDDRAVEAAKAILVRLERLAVAQNRFPPVVKQAIVDAFAKEGISAVVTEL